MVVNRDDHLPAPVQRVIGHAGDELKVSVGRLEIVLVEPAEWPDASLGAPQPGMTYAQAVTPGYRVVLRIGDRELRYHTDQHSRFVRVR